MTSRKLLIDHQQAGTVIFAARQFGKGNVVGNYNGSLMYLNMNILQHKTKKYVETFMQGTRETFGKRVTWIPETMKAWEGKQLQLGYVLRLFVRFTA